MTKKEQINNINRNMQAIVDEQKKQINRLQNVILNLLEGDLEQYINLTFDDKHLNT